jgi:hypothetical protein
MDWSHASSYSGYSPTRGASSSAFCATTRCRCMVACSCPLKISALTPFTDEEKPSKWTWHLAYTLMEISVVDLQPGHMMRRRTCGGIVLSGPSPWVVWWMLGDDGEGYSSLVVFDGTHRLCDGSSTPVHERSAEPSFGRSAEPRYHNFFSQTPSLM